MSVKIRPAQERELDALYALYAHARAFMAKNGNPTQWGQNRPSDLRIRQDVEQGIGYVLEEEGRVLAAFALADGPEPTYAEICGAWKRDVPYGVIHRVACAEHGRGLAGQCIAFCKERYDSLRIDTHENNHPMRALVAKCGFAYCGVIRIENGDERYAYQWDAKQ